jgi:hypothetical protein
LHAYPTHFHADYTHFLANLTYFHEDLTHFHADLIHFMRVRLSVNNFSDSPALATAQYRQKTILYINIKMFNSVYLYAFVKISFCSVGMQK